MSGRLFIALGLALAVSANTASGVASIMAFRHRHAGEMALARGELDTALMHLRASRSWRPDDAPTSVLIGRVIQKALANGLPLEALADHQPADIFSRALSATTHGIGLNPADAWGWFNLVDVFQGLRASRVRLDAMRKAGEAALAGASSPRPPAAQVTEPALSAEERASIAAVYQAIEMEPRFHFYRDHLARLYWDRGMKTEAAREIRASFTLWPRVAVHPAIEKKDLLIGLQGPILEGVEASAQDPLVGPSLALHAKAMLLEGLERQEEAISAYRQLREIADRDLAAQCDLDIGKLEISLGRYRESLPALSRAMEATSDDALTAWALYYLGKAHSGLGDHGKAAEFLRRRVQEFGKSLPAYLALAEEEEALGNSSAAEGLYIAAVMEYPTERVTYVRVIEHLRRHGKQRQAIAYAHALGKNSDDPAEADELVRILELESKHPFP